MTVTVQERAVHELGLGWAGRGWAGCCSCRHRFVQHRDVSAAEADVADHLLEVRLGEVLTVELAAALGRKGRRRAAGRLLDVAGELAAVLATADVDRRRAEAS